MGFLQVTQGLDANDVPVNGSTVTPVPGTAPIVSALVREIGDAAGNTSTTSTMSSGDVLSGALGFQGDVDWVRISLVAGERYTVALAGSTLYDPYLTIYNNAGAFLTYNDDDGMSLNSSVTFTASYTGSYFLSAQAYDTSDIGTYIFTVDSLGAIPTYTMAEIAYQLTNTFWGGNSQGFNVTANSGTITYSVVGLTAAGQGLARDALQIWAETTGLNFVETRGTAAITFDDRSAGAYSTAALNYSATTPNADFQITSSEVNISTVWLGNYGTEYDGYSFQTFIHEIGHALGLGHAGNYNGEAEYPTDAAYTNDSWQATIMSYFSQTDNTAIDADYAYVVSPMIADILAVQDLYGVANDLRTTNTVYGYNCDAGGMYQTLFEGVTSGNLSAVTLTIVDNGGYDTIDLRGETSGQRLNMSGGSVSDVFGLIGNLSIAVGTVIEQAIGGSGNDLITGSAGNNRIIGMDGHDSILAGLGDDFVNGANGYDTVRGGDGNDNVLGGSGNDWIFGDAGSDYLQGDLGRDYLIDDLGNDRLFGGEGDDYLTAGAGEDTLDGGAGNDLMLGGALHDVLYARTGNDTLIGGAGRDSLYGEEGDDVIEGGNARDDLRGGAGADTFVFSRFEDSTTAAPDKIFDFATGVDHIDLSALGATWVGTAAFSGAADELRLYRLGGVSRLEMDHDGDGVADVTILLVNNSNVALSDLIL